MNIELQSRSASALLDEDEPVPRDAAVHVKILSRALYLSRPTQDFKFKQNYKLTLKCSTLATASDQTFLSLLTAPDLRILFVFLTAAGVQQNKICASSRPRIGRLASP